MTIDRISGGWGETGIEQTQGSAAHGRFRAVHDAASSYLGLSADELRGRLANGLSHPALFRRAPAVSRRSPKPAAKSVDGLTQALADAIAKLDSSVNAASIAARIVSRSLGGPPPSGESAPSSSGVGAELTQARRGFGGSSGGSGFENVRGAVNDFLGLTGDEVSSQLVQGQTLGEIAEASGKTAADLEQAIAKVIANGDSRADVGGIAHTIGTTQLGRRGSNANDIGGTDFPGPQGYGPTGGGHVSSMAAQAGGPGESPLDQLLLDKLDTARAGPYEASTILHEPPERATAPAWSTVFPPSAASRPIAFGVGTLRSRPSTRCPRNVPPVP